jgi:hypothetical protein
MPLLSLTLSLLKPKRRGEQSDVQRESARLPKTKPELLGNARKKKLARRRRVKNASALSKKTRSVKLADKKSAVLDEQNVMLVVLRKTDWLAKKRPRQPSVARNAANVSASASVLLTKLLQDRGPSGESRLTWTAQTKKLAERGTKSDACVAPST